MSQRSRKAGKRTGTRSSTRVRTMVLLKEGIGERSPSRPVTRSGSKRSRSGSLPTRRMIIASGVSTQKNTTPIKIGLTILKSCSDSQRQARSSGPNNGAANKAAIKNTNAAIAHQSALCRPPKSQATQWPRRPQQKKAKGPIRTAWRRTLATERFVPIAIGAGHRFPPFHSL